MNRNKWQRKGKPSSRKNCKKKSGGGKEGKKLHCNEDRRKSRQWTVKVEKWKSVSHLEIRFFFNFYLDFLVLKNGSSTVLHPIHTTEYKLQTMALGSSIFHKPNHRGPFVKGFSLCAFFLTWCGDTDTLFSQLVYIITVSIFRPFFTVASYYNPSHSIIAQAALHNS